MTQTDFGQGASLYTLTDELGQTVQVTDLGATIVSIQTRDKDGLLEDVVLGYSCAQDYLTYHSSQGATIGRYANRIRGASFVLNDVHYHITPNEGKNHLHGGNIGLSKKMWKKEYYTEDTLVLSCFSPDGEEGYPGNLHVEVAFLFHKGCLEITYHAKCDQDTPLNITNHSYFSLGPNPLQTQLQINASQIVEVDEQMLPTGNLLNVQNTPFDFLTPKSIEKEIESQHPQIALCHGYDTCFLLDGEPRAMKQAAWAEHPKTGRILEISTDMPGVQLYTANFLDGTEIGKQNFPLYRRSAFCLETQFLPDTPNITKFPTCILRKNELFYSKTTYWFHT